MKRYFVVTEGKMNGLLLRLILGVEQDNPAIVFVEAGGWSGADSLARSILVRNEGEVALVVDADTSDPDSIEERRQFLHDSLHSMASAYRSKVFLIVPEIESLLFQDRNIAECLIGHTISDLDFIRGQYEPKKVLVALLNGQPYIQAFMGRLPTVDLSSLQELPIIKELKAFLDTSVQPSVTSA